MRSIFLSSLAAIVVLILAMIVVQLLGKRERIRERLEKIQYGMAGQKTGEEGEAVYEEQRLSPLAMIMSQILKLTGADPEEYGRNEQMRFYRAGIQGVDGPVYFLFFKRIGMIFCIGLALLLFFSSATGVMKVAYVIGGLMLVVIGVTGPDLYIKNMHLKREKVILQAFPDTLDLLLACVESGLALDGALSRVCKELGKAYPEITEELNRTRLELTLLNDRNQALLNLAERTDLAVFRLLVTALLQSERFGTNLTETLRVLAEDARQTRLMAAEEKAARLPVLMTLPLVTLLLPALFLLILGPAVLKVMQQVHSQ